MSGLRKLPQELRQSLKIVSPRIKDGKEVEPTKVFDNFIDQLSIAAEDPSIKTIVIDSFTTMTEVLFDKITGSAQPEVKVQIQHYGDYARYVKWFGDLLLANPELDKHVVMIAHEVVEKDELEQTITRTLAVPTKVKNTFPLYFSDAWRCYAKVPVSGDIKYMVRTAPGSNFSAKCSLPLKNDFEWDVEQTNIMKQLDLS